MIGHSCLSQCCWCSIVGSIQTFCSSSNHFVWQKLGTANHFMHNAIATCQQYWSNNGTKWNRTDGPRNGLFVPSKQNEMKQITNISYYCHIIYYTYHKTNPGNPRATQSFWCRKVDQTKAPEGKTPNWWLHTATAGHMTYTTHATRHYCAPYVLCWNRNITMSMFGKTA